MPGWNLNHDKEQADEMKARFSAMTTYDLIISEAETKSLLAPGTDVFLSIRRRQYLEQVLDIMQEEIQRRLYKDV